MIRYQRDGMVGATGIEPVTPAMSRQEPAPEAADCLGSSREEPGTEERTAGEQTESIRQVSAKSMTDIMTIYAGSNGDATKALYMELEAVGPLGVLAANLFRANKSSSRAKVYRGRRYTGAAYDRKEWSLGNIASVLMSNDLGIRWGWKLDQRQEFHRWVLYVDLPTGQVSFHTSARGDGPDYPGEWDGRRDVAAGRIIAFAHSVLAGKIVPVTA